MRERGQPALSFQKYYASGPRHSDPRNYGTCVAPERVVVASAVKG